MQAGELGEEGNPRDFSTEVQALLLGWRGSFTNDLWRFNELQWKNLG